VDALVAHYHEIGLKGRNRQFFEEALSRNLKRAMRGTGYRRLWRGFGRMHIDFNPDSRFNEAVERAGRVFGVAFLGAGRKTAPDLDSLAAVALELMEAEPFESFAVRARRSYSVVEHTSQEINTAIGQVIKDATGARVDLKRPDATVWIELFGKQAVVYRRRVMGPGGLPAGVSGRMLVLLSGGIDSPVAAWRMGRRGAEVELVHFHGQPFTDPSSIRQASDLAHALAGYHLRLPLHLMMRIAAALAAERGALAIVTGDSLGQVASQTMENLRTVDAAVSDQNVLRPLIGFDKQEIIDSAKAIGTYEISSRNYQDCCVLFEPRSPATRATVEQADAAERDLDIDALVGKALAGIETRIIELPEP
jgi:thiamine biosynthesis protein ThiI